MKLLLPYWNLYERIWLLVFSAVAIGITLFSGDNLFGFMVFLSGVFCVVLAAKGSILNYPAGLVNVMGYAWISWQNGLYGEVGLNLFFYLPMNVMGFLMWRKHMSDHTVTMRKMTARNIATLTVLCLLAMGGLGFCLSLLKGQNSPFLDAITNVLAIVATLLMMRRYREQWGAYVILNVLCVVLWAVRTAKGSPDGWLMITMWSAYLINAFYGWHNWTKGAKLAQITIEERGEVSIQ